MNARDIIRSLVRDRYRQSLCIPNYTPENWWECDVFEVSKSGYFREFEVKVSRSDFFADAKKETVRYPGGWYSGFKGVTENKHELLAAGDVRGPSIFYYVTPEGLLKPDEIPPWAGLIEVRDGNSVLYTQGEFTSVPRIFEREIKKAPRLHREKVAQAVIDHVRGVCYYRMHNLLQERQKLNAA